MMLQDEGQSLVYLGQCEKEEHRPPKNGEEADWTQYLSVVKFNVYRESSLFEILLGKTDLSQG